jgi:hypothetical protein
VICIVHYPLTGCMHITVAFLGCSFIINSLGKVIAKQVDSQSDFLYIPLVNLYFDQFSLEWTALLDRGVWIIFLQLWRSVLLMGHIWRFISKVSGLHTLLNKSFLKIIMSMTQVIIFALNNILPSTKSEQGSKLDINSKLCWVGHVHVAHYLYRRNPCWSERRDEIIWASIACKFSRGIRFTNKITSRRNTFHWALIFFGIFPRFIHISMPGMIFRKQVLLEIQYKIHWKGPWTFEGYLWIKYKF